MEGSVVTFYSYKGGVGRTMALANTAVTLASWRYRVLVIDWDFEAPGISFYFNPYDNSVSDQKPGIVDILKESSPKDNTRTPNINWKQCVQTVHLKNQSISLDIITSGKRDENYHSNIRNFDVTEYYEENGGAFIESLRRDWKQAYDFVLIDSRTGFTDVGGICTIHLPDLLALVFSTSEQGLEGGIKLARQAREKRKNIPYDRTTLCVLPIISRIEDREEYNLYNEFMHQASDRLAPLVTNWIPTDTDCRQLLEATKLPYVPYFSFGEKLPSVEKNGRDYSGLRLAYESNAALIANGMSFASDFLENRNSYIRTASEVNQIGSTLTHSNALFQRRMHKNHRRSIQSGVLVENSVAQKIINQIFNHFPAVFSNAEPNFNLGRNKAATNSKTDVEPSADWLSWNFYNHYYSKVGVCRGLTYEDQGLDIESFIDQITSPLSNKERNNFHFLVGDIGNGKTTFINWLISTQFVSSVESSSFWFFRINPEFLPADVSKSKQERVKSFLDSLLYRLTFVVTEISKNSSRYGCTEEDFTSPIFTIRQALATDESILKKSLIKRAIDEVNELTGRSCLLIVDNLDSYFHENDRYMFLNNHSTGEDTSIEVLSEIITDFLHAASDLGRMGVNVLFVMRPDSYLVMQSTRSLFKGFEACFNDDKNAFSISTPTWNEIIRERLNLLNHVSHSLQTSNHDNSIREQIDYLLQDLDVSTFSSTKNDFVDLELFKHLKSLSNQGLRAIVEFFSIYAWLPINSALRKELTTRYVHHNPVGLIGYFLGNKRLYSQDGSNFPNLYMVNANAFSDDALVRVKSEGRLDTTHSHTYWLKLLLLKYIHHGNNHSNESITFDSILEIFCGNRNISMRGYYEQNIVRLTLGSFAQSHKTSLVRISRKVSADGSSLLLAGDLELTDRAVALIEGLCWSFPYIQLVVDDHYLKIPRKCMNAFQYEDDLHYGYIVSQTKEYADRSDDMLLNKIQLVAKFLAILHISYDLESRIYNDVFRNFDELDIPTITPMMIEKSITSEITAISLARTKRGLFKQHHEEIGPKAFSEKISVYRSNLYPVVEGLYINTRVSSNTI